MNVFLSILAVLGIGYAVGMDSVTGSGKLVSETRTVPEFSGISVSGSAKVFITQDQVQSVRVESDDNIISHVETKVRDGVLSIGFDRGSYNNVTLNVYISAQKIRQLEVAGSGNISTTAPISTDRLDCEIAGSGKITVAGRAEVQHIDIAGSGRFNGFDLAGSTCNIDIAGSGHCEVNPTKELHADISGSGTIIYMNDPHITKDISGSGRVKKRN